jgi:hypothetical protein
MTTSIMNSRFKLFHRLAELRWIPKAINTHMMVTHRRFPEMAVLCFIERSVLPQTKFIMVFPGRNISWV